MRSRSGSLAVRSGHCYLRVSEPSPDLIRGVSSSCICAKILALRCCGRMIAAVSMGRRRRRCSKRFNPRNQAYRNRLATPCRSTSTQRNNFSFLALPEGGVEMPLMSPGEVVWPSVSTGQIAVQRPREPFGFAQLLMKISEGDAPAKRRLRLDPAGDDSPIAVASQIQKWVTPEVDWLTNDRPLYGHRAAHSRAVHQPSLRQIIILDGAVLHRAIVPHQ